MNAPAVSPADESTAGPATLSVMLWFRADPGQDEAVRAALTRLARAIAPDAGSRIGHRHEEDRPYRTWMIDAGPVSAERFDALLYRMHKAVDSVGIAPLMQGDPHLECFAWQDCRD